MDDYKDPLDACKDSLWDEGQAAQAFLDNPSVHTAFAWSQADDTADTLCDIANSHHDSSDEENHYSISVDL